MYGHHKLFAIWSDHEDIVTDFIHYSMGIYSAFFMQTFFIITGLCSKFSSSFSYFLWKNDIGGCTPPNGESVGNLQKRAEEAVYKIAHENDGKTVAIFTHACFIRSLQCLYSGLPLSEMKSLKWVPNASVTEVEFCGKNAELLKVGQADHLKSLQTELNAKL